ncbi:MAG: hypothetical protein LBH79_01835 [Nitrososphaerota archaeon]|jgi:hypothetical protein|nr:hypothetical protein [Nitrososphaerota archaeon]
MAGSACVANNTAGTNGGGVYVTGGSFNVMDSAKVADNTANNGGGVYVTGGSFNVMDSAKVADNTAGSDGGGVFVFGESASFVMSDEAQVSKNTASVSGGGVCVAFGTFVMSDWSVVADNTAGSDGGGVYIFSNYVNFEMNGDAKVADNTASFDGGGVYLTSYNDILVSGIISGNTAAEGNGGGIYLLWGQLYIRNADIIDNCAPNGDGGGIWTYSLDALFIDSVDSPNETVFSGNSASKATSRLVGDDDTYFANIFTDNWSSSLTQGYNNYDIIYLNGEPVDPDHTWGEWIVTTPPTHDGPGEETRTCNDCDETQTRDVPATGPVLVSYTVYYYSQGTTTSLAPSKVVSGQTMGTSVTESAITITGYTVVAPASVTANLNATNIAFIFYYTVNSGGSGGSSGSSSGSSSSSSSKASTPSTVPLDDGDGADDVVVQPYDGDLPPAEINEDESLPAWSLVSLVLSVAGVILAVILVVAVLMWRRNQKQTVLKHGQTLWFFLGLILGIAGILVFFLTEDLSRTMSIVGQWTAVNVIIFIVQVIAVVFTFKLYKTTNSNRTNDNNSTA